MNRQIAIATRSLDEGGFAASVVEDSWANDSDSGFLGWSTFKEDREDSPHDAFVVLRSRLRGFAGTGDVFDFSHARARVAGVGLIRSEPRTTELL